MLTGPHMREMGKHLRISSQQRELVSFFSTRHALSQCVPANINPSFSSHYDDAESAGLTRGAYHLARLYSSNGADQANYFLSNGGEWTSDGNTLPGALWLECM
jgi:hypothetical protein